MVQPTKLMWVPAEAAASGVTSVREGEAGRRDDRDQVAGEHVDREGVAEVELVHFRRSVHDVVLVGHPPYGRHRVQLETRNYLGDLYTESGQTLQGSFLAVSKPNFASKYALE